LTAQRIELRQLHPQLVGRARRRRFDAVVQRDPLRFPQQAAEYRQGKVKMLGFFVGQVMKESRGKANPKMVQEVLKKKLG
jgi:Asp-tRNA(Asn)/Glu-tRNA(Gln) amidotransferase B subunit